MRKRGEEIKKRREDQIEEETEQLKSKMKNPRGDKEHRKIKRAKLKETKTN